MEFNISREFKNRSINNQYIGPNTWRKTRNSKRPISSDWKHGKRYYSTENDRNVFLSQRLANNSREKEGNGRIMEEFQPLQQCQQQRLSMHSPEFTNNQYTDPNALRKAWDPKRSPIYRDWKVDKREHSPEKEWRAKQTKEDKGNNKIMEQFQPLQLCQQQPISIHSASTSYPTNWNATSYPGDYRMSHLNTMDQWGAPVTSSMPNMASMSAGSINYSSNDPVMYGMMAPMLRMMPVKIFSSCTLLPPPPGAEVPSRRNRPNGCKTVFVGGLPKKATEEIIREAFSDCGKIATVRMNRKNFCHIRFESEHHVDQAMSLSGYHIKVEDKDGPTYSSRLHVDFAVARDDLNEFECSVHASCDKAWQAKEDLPLPSLAPIVNFSECKGFNIHELLRDEKTFKPAVEVVINFLDKEECNKKNAGKFYSLIQSVYSLVGRLVAAKNKIECEVTEVKQRLHQQSASNATHFKDIERVFSYACMQKAWDHFTKAQRKHIEQWKKILTDTQIKNLNDLLEERNEDEMEMSDNEDQDTPKDSEKSELSEELCRLQEENELLRGQLRTASVESASLKDESKSKMTALGDAYQLMQQNYLDTKKKLEKVLKGQDKLASGYRKVISLDWYRSEPVCNEKCDSGVIKVTESDVCLISLIAIFLNIHPLGANIDCICSYLVKMDRNVTTRDVETLMKKFNTVFKEESSGISENLETKWTFCGYK